MVTEEAELLAGGFAGSVRFEVALEDVEEEVLVEEEVVVEEEAVLEDVDVVVEDLVVEEAVLEDVEELALDDEEELDVERTEEVALDEVVVVELEATEVLVPWLLVVVVLLLEVETVKAPYARAMTSASITIPTATYFAATPDLDLVALFILLTFSGSIISN
jgi:hypothetical protein